MKIIVSRTDSIGDVILTLPLCGWIKKHIPEAEVYFLCQALTQEIVKRSSYVDNIFVWNGTLPEADAIIHVFPNVAIAKAAKKKKIQIRIGTSHRFFHLNTCNRLVNFSRIKSLRHESQLNFKLLKVFGHEVLPDLTDMPSFVDWKTITDRSNYSNYLSDTKFNLIFHIKSRGSAKEWKADNYLELAKKLSEDQYNIILTGTEPEGKLIRDEIPDIFKLRHVTNSIGKLNLSELIDLIGKSDGLLACSTGPLHIAGISEIYCLGLYPKKKPMHAGRWGPLGSKSDYIEEKKKNDNKYLNISVKSVHKQLKEWRKL